VVTLLNPPSREETDPSNGTGLGVVNEVDCCEENNIVTLLGPPSREERKKP
jgi:hypothetical protein